MLIKFWIEVLTDLCLSMLICRNVISIDEYAVYFDNIDPLAPFKKWGTIDVAVDRTRKCSINSERVQAAFIVSDSVDWSRDIQVTLNNITISVLIP